MNNTFAAGSEYGHQLGPPVNEDYAMIIAVDSVSGGVITGHKYWDESSSPQSYSATAFYFGAIGTPTDAEMTVDYIIFYRVGTGHGSDSWICFVLRVDNE